MLSRCDATHDSIHDMVSAEQHYRHVAKVCSNEQEVSLVVWEGIIGVITNETVMEQCRMRVYEVLSRDNPPQLISIQLSTIHEPLGILCLRAFAELNISKPSWKIDCFVHGKLYVLNCAKR